MEKPMSQDGSLTSTHTLIEFHCRIPSGLRQDRQASSELASNKKANAKRVKVQKNTFGCDELDIVRKETAKVRSYIYSMTLPWGESGQRLLANSVQDEVSAKVDDWIDDIEVKYQKFLDRYDFIRDESKRELGDLAKDDDYWSVEKLKDKFQLTRPSAWATSVPDPELDVRAGWSKPQMSRMKDSMQKQNATKVRSACRETADRLEKVLGRMVERLDKYGKDENGKVVGEFRNTLVGHVRDIAGLLPAFNIENDPKVEKVRQRIISDLCTVDITDLRKDPDLRKDVKAKAQDILNRVGNFGKDRD
jgi:hypothetical protein